MATPDTMAKVAESEAQCPKSAAERQLSAGSNAPGSAPEQRPVSQSGSVLFLDPEMVLDLAPKRGVRVLSAKGHRGDASRLKADLRALQRRVTALQVCPRPCDTPTPTHPTPYLVDTPRPSPRTNRTRRVLHPVLIGHAASD